MKLSQGLVSIALVVTYASGAGRHLRNRSRDAGDPSAIQRVQGELKEEYESNNATTNPVEETIVDVYEADVRSKSETDPPSSSPTVKQTRSDASILKDYYEFVIKENNEETSPTRTPSMSPTSAIAVDSSSTTNVPTKSPILPPTSLDDGNDDVDTDTFWKDYFDFFLGRRPPSPAPVDRGDEFGESNFDDNEAEEENDPDPYVNERPNYDDPDAFFENDRPNYNDPDTFSGGRPNYDDPDTYDKDYFDFYQGRRPSSAPVAQAGHGKEVPEPTFAPTTPFNIQEGEDDNETGVENPDNVVEVPTLSPTSNAVDPSSSPTNAPSKSPPTKTPSVSPTSFAVDSSSSTTNAPTKSPIRPPTLPDEVYEGDEDPDTPVNDRPNYDDPDTFIDYDRPNYDDPDTFVDDGPNYDDPDAYDKDYFDYYQGGKPTSAPVAQAGSDSEVPEPTFAPTTTFDIQEGDDGNDPDEDSQVDVPTLSPSETSVPARFNSVVPSEAPSNEPSASQEDLEEIINVPTLSPSETSVPARFNSVVPSEAPSNEPSVSQEDLEEIINVPTLSPSESFDPSSSVPSVSPSNEPSVSLADAVVLVIPPNGIAAKESPTNLENIANVPTLPSSKSPGPSVQSFSPNNEPSVSPRDAVVLVIPPHGIAAKDSPTNLANTVNVPTLSPSGTLVPARFNSAVPSEAPSNEPSVSQEDLEGIINVPTLLPSDSFGPSVQSVSPSNKPSVSQEDLEEIMNVPSLPPSNSPGPSNMPSVAPSIEPTFLRVDTGLPTLGPSVSNKPSSGPSNVPSLAPSNEPSLLRVDNEFPTLGPSKSQGPSNVPSSFPSIMPSLARDNDVGTDFQTGAPSGSKDLNYEGPTDEPSSVSLIGSCDLAASVKCETGSGFSCNNLLRVPEDDLICDSRPTQLGWLYTGNDCDGTIDGFYYPCRDFAGGPSSASTVYVEVLGADSLEIYYAGTMQRPQLGSTLDSFWVDFSNETYDPNSLLLRVKRDGPDGELLQIMILPYLCHRRYGKTLGVSYGAIEFGGYQTATKSIQSFETLTWTYTAKNLGSLDLTLRRVTTVTEGHTESFDQEYLLQPYDKSSYVVRETVRLDKNVVFSGAMTAVAMSSNGMECAGSAARHYDI